MRSRADIALSCLYDDTPSIRASFIPWLATAVDLAGIAPAQIHVHHTVPLPSTFAACCRTHGVTTHAVEPFDQRFPHTNKIRQCFTNYGNAHRVILTDVDVAFARPLPLEQIDGPLAGKPVDQPNPPVEILNRLFTEAGIAAPAPLSWNGFTTLPGNCNGGLYIIECGQLATLGEAWGRRARWLIERITILERWAIHADQVAFCLAANELKLPVQQLGDEWNLPLHLPLQEGGEPIVLHHHAALTPKSELAVTGHPRVDRLLPRINRAIRRLARTTRL